MTSFSLRTVPWGKIGTVIDGDVKTAQEAAALGGLDFEVELLEAGFRSTQHEPRRSPWRGVPNRVAVVRKDTQEFMNFASRGYSPVQYGDAFAFMDEINPRYVAAGALMGGRQGFLVAQLPEIDSIAPNVNGVNDPHDLYVIMRTSHDYSRGVELCVLCLRNRCMNSLTLSRFTSGSKQRWSTRHAGQDPLSRLANARDTLLNVRTYHSEFEQIVKRLGHIDDISNSEAVSVLERALPDKPKRPQQITNIFTRWRDDDEDQTNGFCGNGWGLVNAVSEYMEWGRPEGLRNPQSVLLSNLEGATHKVVDSTAQIILEELYA
jgi:phage/plasmid-like protein (TIGR03299 family)